MGDRIREELAWAAGFFDGEGTFGTTKNKWTRTQVSQIHPEPLLRMQQALGVGYVSGPFTNKARKLGPQRQPIWHWHVNKFEHAQHVVATLWPWLGTPKREQAAEMLRTAVAWYLREREPCPNLLKTHCANGHPFNTENTYWWQGHRQCRACKMADAVRQHELRRTTKTALS